MPHLRSVGVCNRAVFLNRRDAYRYRDLKHFSNLTEKRDPWFDINFILYTCFLTKFNNLSSKLLFLCILCGKKAYNRTLQQQEVAKFFLTGTVVSKLAFSRYLELKRLRNTAIGYYQPPAPSRKSYALDRIQFLSIYTMLHK